MNTEALAPPPLPVGGTTSAPTSTRRPELAIGGLVLMAVGGFAAFFAFIMLIASAQTSSSYASPSGLGPGGVLLFFLMGVPGSYTFYRGCRLFFLTLLGKPVG